jgi:hypothetical protein
MSPETISRHELILVTEAAALIAKHVTFSNRSTEPKKLITQNIRDSAALTKRRLQNQVAVYRDEVFLWAAKKWPSFADAYGISRVSSADILSSGVVRDFCDMTVIPGEIKKCQAHLIAAYDELEKFRSQIAGLEAEIARLKPKAESRRKSDAGLDKARRALARAKK